MRRTLTANRVSRSHLIVCFSASLLLLALLSNKLDAQGMRMASKNEPNPTGLPPTGTGITPPNHDGWGLAPGGAEEPAIKAARFINKPVKRKRRCPICPPETPPCEPIPILSQNNWWNRWSFSLSALYQFSNQRSRVGDLSWNSNAAGIDFTAAFDEWPYPSFDFLYFYSHFDGSSPAGANDVTNQHIGAVRILQPLNPIWSSNWRPADQSTHQVNQQLATLFRAAYGGSIGSLVAPNFAFEHDTDHAFVGDALLDYQFAWFPCRMDTPDAKCKYLPKDKACPTYSYPSLVLELTSGPEFSTQRLDSSTSGSAITTSGTQIDYLNSATLLCSLPCRLGFLIGVQWNAPLDSQPTRGRKPDHANTAIFTGGLVYNLFPYTKPGIRLDPRRFTLNLLYSYTAFDPLSETNALQLQISYSF